MGHLAMLLRSMEPILHRGVYTYCVVSRETSIDNLTPVAMVSEAEGLTLVLPEEQAINAGFSVLLRAAWITLTVHSVLQAVGLTAAFATALAQHSISCNVVAGAYHDHLFVPSEQAQQALAVLQALQQEALQ